MRDWWRSLNDEIARTGGKMLPFIALFLTCSIPAFSETLKGTVNDSAGSPIPGTLIVVHWDSSGSTVGLSSNQGIKNDLFLKTDAYGRFAAELPPGFYDVFVSSRAFTPVCRKIRIKASKEFVYNPRLNVDPLVGVEVGDTVVGR
jgi:hypothetical protein